MLIVVFIPTEVSALPDSCSGCGKSGYMTWNSSTCTYYCSSCKGTYTWHNGYQACSCGCKICYECGEAYNNYGFSCCGDQWGKVVSSCSGSCCSGSGSGGNTCYHTTTYTTGGASCSSGGYRYTKCWDCNETLSSVWEDATGNHSYTVYVSTTAATCTAQGYDTYKCSSCTATTKKNYTSVKGHSWKDNGATNHKCSTCSTTQAHTDTNTDYKCDVCGRVLAINISGSATIADVSNQVYTGSAIEPTPAVMYNSTTLIAGTDFTYSYSNNIFPGDTATVTVTGKGAYTGTVSKTFTIVNASFDGYLTISGAPGYNQTLTADVSTISPNTGVNFTYQWWIADDELGTNQTNISGATTGSYVVPKEYIGKYIGVSVTASKQYYNSKNFEFFVNEEITGVRGTIAVLNGVDYDNVKYVPRSVRLSVDASGYFSSLDNVRVAILNAEEYAEYSSGNMANVVWKNYANEMTYTLSGNSGLRDIYALFREEFDISFNLNGGSGSGFASTTVFYGDSVVLPLYSGSKAGYTFKGWSTDSMATSAMWSNGAVIGTCVVEDDTEFFATWVDEDAPAIALNGSVNSDLPVVVPIKVTELGSGLDSFKKEDILVYVDGVLVNPTTKELNSKSSSNGVYQYELVLDGFEDGGELVLVINGGTVKDLAGNGNATTTLNTGVNLVVDIEGPVVTLTADDSVDKLSDLNAVAVDKSAISKYEFYLNDSLINTTDTSATEFTYDAHTLFGENTAYVKAYDVHGNVGISNTVTFWDYDIENATEFRLFSDYVGGNNGKTVNTFKGKTVRMLNDVDLQNVAYTPIGYNGEGVNNFEGTFDGLYHSVSNVNISSSDTVAALFRTNSGTIKNFGIASGTISTSGNYCDVAGVVYYNDQNGLVENCYNNATISTTGYNSGGGGICYMSLGTIRGCYNSGTLSLESTLMGGICACTAKISVIENCYNTGVLQTNNVGITYSAGGIVGNTFASMIQNPDGSYTQIDAGGTIKNCYNVGKVTTKATAGGTVSGHAINGNTEDRKITGTNCYYLTGCGVASSSNLQYTYYSSGTARSEANMKNASFLTLLNNASGAGTWKYVSGVNGGYPVLYWQ